MKVTWQLQPEARSDLRQVGEYIARDSPQRAGEFVQRLLDRCDRQSQRPSPARNVSGRYVPAGTKRVVEGNYHIYYRQEKDKPLSILRIVRGDRDLRLVFDRTYQRQREARERSDTRREVKEFNRVKQERSELKRYRELSSDRRERQRDRAERESREKKKDRDLELER